MKLWQKLCICSLLFFLLLFLSSGVIIIEHNTKVVFNRILQQASDEQTGISSGIMQYVMLSRAKNPTKDGLNDKKYIKEFLNSRINSWGIYLELQDDNEILYSNLEFDMPPMKDKITPTSLIQFKKLKIETRDYLLLTATIPLKNHPILSRYIIDISNINMDRHKQYSFFIELAFTVSIILTFGMYLITRYFTKSLRVLTKSVREMEKGNYKMRVELQTKDEIGILSKSYNEMADSIEEKIIQLEQKTTAQQRFIDNFTHELRSPLTGVIGYSDLLRSTVCNELSYQELGERIFREGKRIEKLSELMMDLIFLERHTFTLVPINLGELIEEAVKLIKPSVKNAGMELNYKLPNEPIVISAEKNLLLSLLSNLIDNSKKASIEGNNIWIRCRKDNNKVLVDVEDEGKGIPKKDINKVFESFYMVDKVRSGKNKGIGLGLSICAEIVKLHNGQIMLDSEVGKGTLITILFPCYN